MNDILWTAVLAQMLMGGFDTAWHHEGTQRLAWRPSAARELRLHGVRNLAYAAMFAALGCTEPHGAAAVALIALMTGELIITLWDFVEEDRTRNLPATERVTHTLLTLNYGVVLALLTSTASSMSTDSALSCVVVRPCTWVVESAPIWSAENEPSAVVVSPPSCVEVNASACVAVKA